MPSEPSVSIVLAPGFAFGSVPGAAFSCVVPVFAPPGCVPSVPGFFSPRGPLTPRWPPSTPLRISCPRSQSMSVPSSRSMAAARALRSASEVGSGMRLPARSRSAS